MATVIDNLKNKIENGGLTAQGRLSAAEFNLLVNAEIEVIERSEVAAYIGPDDGTGGYISEGGEVDLSDYAKKTDLATKQDVLQSGVNIKTINGETILGSGNISVSGGSGGGGDANVIESISVNGTPQTVSEKNVDITVPTKTSDLTNDSGFLTSHQDISGKANDNAVVHKTGNESISGNKLMEGILYVGDADNYIENNNGALKLSSDVSVTLAGNAVDVETDMWVDGDITAGGGIQASDTSKQSTSKFFATDGTVQSFKTINNESIVGTGNISVSGGGSGGDTNVIETVKVNGTALTVTNKAVDVPAVTSFNGSTGAVTYSAPVTSVNGSTGAVTLTLGDANVIEAITFNGTSVSVTNKTAAITASIPNDANLIHASGDNETIQSHKIFYNKNKLKFYDSDGPFICSSTATGADSNDLEIGNVTNLNISSYETTFSGNITASSFIVPNGTSSQFLKADGSVDTSTYLTSHQDITGKADKSATVSTVAYDTTNKKITKTINGTTTDVVTAAAIVSDGGGVISSDVTSIVKLTQAAYDAIATPSSTTLYIIIPASS